MQIGIAINLSPQSQPNHNFGWIFYAKK